MEGAVKNSINALAVYQVFGGILGIGLAIRIVQQIKDVEGTGMAMIAFACCLYLFSIICGIILFNNVKRGLTFSLINQVLQVVYFAIGPFAYNYVSGFKLGLGISFIPEWQITLNLALSSFELFLNTETGKVFVGFNLLALLLVYFIERLKERVS